MNDRIAIIVEGIEAAGDVRIYKQIELDGIGILRGGIIVNVKNCSIQFELTIYPPYPMQFHGNETITFINTDLIDYGHVNSDGSLCIHTPHNTKLKDKIYYDLQSVKDWIVKYYLNKDEDEHYDHIIVGESTSKDHYSTYLFTSVDYEFNKGEFGFLYATLLSQGFHKERPILTYIIQGFKTSKAIIRCQWSDRYARMEFQRGIFIFTDVPPVYRKKFGVETWAELESYVTQDFLKFLYEVQRKNDLKKRGIVTLPLFIGYRIPNGIHWQCALIDIRNFPIYTQREGKTYKGHFSSELINWASTENCSYELFFGRGAFCSALTEKRILIIGVGAIGSMVATTLTRGGCRSIAITDYDIKEPENICRSEYRFNTGLNSKVTDLKNALIETSPFIEVGAFPEFTDEVKRFINDKRFREPIKTALETFDLIIDCTADNDVAYILDILSITSDVVNLSITNHAEEIICVVKPDLYERKAHISSLLDKGDVDVYNPIGCWSPTFKASYNDVAVMVQAALKTINRNLIQGLPVRSFFLKYDDLNLNTHLF